MRAFVLWALFLPRFTTSVNRAMLLSGMTLAVSDTSKSVGGPTGSSSGVLVQLPPDTHIIVNPEIMESSRFFMVLGSHEITDEI